MGFNQSGQSRKDMNVLNSENLDLYDILGANQNVVDRTITTLKTLVISGKSQTNIGKIGTLSNFQIDTIFKKGVTRSGREYSARTDSNYYVNVRNHSIDERSMTRSGQKYSVESQNKLNDFGKYLKEIGLYIEKQTSPKVLKLAEPSVPGNPKNLFNYLEAGDIWDQNMNLPSPGIPKSPKDPEVNLGRRNKRVRFPDLPIQPAKKPKKNQDLVQCPWPGCERTARKDNIRNHLRIHTDSKIFSCPFEHQDANGVYHSCEYKAMRRDDFKKHKQNIHMIRNSSYQFSLKPGHRYMNLEQYTSILQKNPAFMTHLAVKIMKQWTAIFNKTTKGRIKDTITRSKIANKDHRMFYLPCLYCPKYNTSGMKSLQEMEQEGNRVLTNPRFLFCDQMLELYRFDFGPFMYCFDKFITGNKVEDEFLC